MDDIAVDQIIAEKKTEIAAAVPAPKAAPVAEAPKVEAAPAEVAPKAEETAAPEEVAEDAPEADGRTPWPKTAVNAMARRDRKLNQLRARDAELQQKLSDATFLEQKLAELKGISKPAAVAPAGDPEPDITKYNDWDKYNADLRAWDKRQVTAELKGTMTETQKAEQQDALIASRFAHADKTEAEILKTNPEFEQVLQQNADVLGGFPDHAKYAILSSDNPTLAVVVLANEGSLEDLADMSPALAEKTVKAAYQRGLSLIAKDEGSEEPDIAPVAKKVSQAPTPMKPARAVTQTGTKRAKDMNDAEFRKEWVG